MSSHYEIVIQGFVQGQGVRPAIARLAKKHGWSGSVCNTPQGVRVVLLDMSVTLVELEDLLRGAHPALATSKLSILPTESTGMQGFCIEESKTNGGAASPVPRDVALCADCLAEVQDPRNRRHQYGLITCTRCGPRFSIIQSMPFDRSRTTLAHFPLCVDCAGEYASYSNRREHAQTIGCPKCGPHVWATDRQQRTLANDDEACQIAAIALLRGDILALRGVGGYQLLADATNDTAVQELRRRKKRRSKPFAVMCVSISEADRYGEFTAAARAMLQSPANPIVIVGSRDHPRLASSIHPHLTDIGLMFPTTAIHQRLLQIVDRPIVCTSGNLEGAPLAVQVADATTDLREIADIWLHHDRPIAHGIDDSVVRSVAGRTMTIRCARGLAPLPLNLPASSPFVAVGSLQNAAIACSNGEQSALGPYLGDLADLTTRERWVHSSRHLQAMYQISDPTWVCDAHPDDVSPQLIPASQSSVRVWHHHAHIVSAMLEHGWFHQPVIGMAADGQGYGCDGTLWGGEVLWATASRFQRLASVRRFTLPGGELAVWEPSRTAVALLSQLPDVTPLQIGEWLRIDITRVVALQQSLRSSASAFTSSLGRLFDAVAWLILGIEATSYIGEPAMRLEAVCDPRAEGSYPWAIEHSKQPWELDWRPALRAIIRDRCRDVPVGVMAERFHRGVVECMIDVYRRCPQLPLVVSGGVFQNRRLCEILTERWPAHGPPLGLPGAIPPNDGGLAAGQLAIASTMRSVPESRK